MTDISVCFGTMDRYELLRSCVESIRRSVGPLSYEMVITDGGSTDGTLDYLRAQSDVVLIEHGARLGAVQAYRDAVAKASGEYVCYLSDDLTLSDEALMAAVFYLREHPTCGVVAITYRNIKMGKVALNFANVRGEVVPFASYGVLRKADGDKAGWFAPGIYHYFLDVSVCMNILKLGLTIDPLRGDHLIEHEMADSVARGKHDGSYSKKNDDKAFNEFAEEWFKGWTYDKAVACG